MKDKIFEDYAQFSFGLPSDRFLIFFFLRILNYLFSNEIFQIKAFWFTRVLKDEITEKMFSLFLSGNLKITSSLHKPLKFISAFITK